MNRLSFENAYTIVHLDGGETVTAKCLLIATGADYRRLGVEGSERFEGTGVYYAATLAEAQLCQGSQVIVVGGGNSAGPGGGLSCRVTPAACCSLIRGDDLYKNMSSYLVRRIEQTPNIELICNTTIRRMNGDTHLARWTSSIARPGEERTVETPGVFSFIGADPRTGWLPEEIERDEKGFVRTGADVATFAALDFRAASRFCWRPAGRACLRPGMCGRAR